MRERYFGRAKFRLAATRTPPDYGSVPMQTRVVVGGGRPADLGSGWYVEPTVFADVDNSMKIAQEEIFGPGEQIAARVRTGVVAFGPEGIGPYTELQSIILPA